MPLAINDGGLGKILVLEASNGETTPVGQLTVLPAQNSDGKDIQLVLDSNLKPLPTDGEVTYVDWSKLPKTVEAGPGGDLVAVTNDGRRVPVTDLVAQLPGIRTDAAGTIPLTDITPALLTAPDRSLVPTAVPAAPVLFGDKVDDKGSKQLALAWKKKKNNLTLGDWKIVLQPIDKLRHIVKNVTIGKASKMETRLYQEYFCANSTNGIIQDLFNGGGWSKLQSIGKTWNNKYHGCDMQVSHREFRDKQTNEMHYLECIFLIGNGQVKRAVVNYKGKAFENYLNEYHVWSGEDLRTGHHERDITHTKKAALARMNRQRQGQHSEGQELRQEDWMTLFDPDAKNAIINNLDMTVTKDGSEWDFDPFDSWGL